MKQKVREKREKLKMILAEIIGRFSFVGFEPETFTNQYQIQFNFIKINKI